MTAPVLFTPAFVCDPCVDADRLEKIAQICREAPATYGGSDPVLAVSRRVIVADDLSVTPVEGIVSHRALNGAIAGYMSFDEMTPAEQNHFEPLFRLFAELHPIRSARSRRGSPVLRDLVSDNSLTEFTIAFFPGFCAVFPTQFSEASKKVHFEYGYAGPQNLGRAGSIRTRSSLCTVILPPPTSNHERLEQVRHMSSGWNALRKVLHAFSVDNLLGLDLDQFDHQNTDHIYHNQPSR